MPKGHDSPDVVGMHLRCLEEETGSGLCADALRVAGWGDLESLRAFKAVDFSYNVVIDGNERGGRVSVGCSTFSEKWFDCKPFPGKAMNILSFNMEPTKPHSFVSMRGEWQQAVGLTLIRIFWPDGEAHVR